MMEVSRKSDSAIVVGDGKDGEKAVYLIDFEKTELRLGLPGRRTIRDHGLAGKPNHIILTNFNGKRGFDQEQEETDDVDYLKLKLSSELEVEIEMDPNQEKKKMMTNYSPPKPSPPQPKAQVVGWPPVRSFRKNIKGVQKNTTTATKEDIEKVNDNNNIKEKPISLVKVSLDGAPYLRKVDLNMYNNYRDLSNGLTNLFTSFTIGKCGSHEGMKEECMNENQLLMDLLNGSDYVQTYEDKDGDWMLVGDVPWQMFVGSCKRLRIMKGAEAIGLAPRAMEKCKNRS